MAGCHHGSADPGSCPRCLASPLFVPANPAPDPHAGKLLVTLGGVARWLSPMEARQLAGLPYFPYDSRNATIADNAHSGQSDYL